MSPTQKGELRVWLGTAAVAMVFAGAIYIADAFLFAPRFQRRELSLALAFGFVQAVAIAVFVFGLFLRKSAQSRRHRRSLEIERELQEALALQSIGLDQLPRLQLLMKRSRRDVEHGIVTALATVRSGARGRLLMVARALGIPQPDERQRLDAMFSAAAAGTLRDRAVIVEELEPDALELATDQIPTALSSSDPRRVAAALDMVRAWKRMLAITNVEQALKHPDPTVRVRALQALPYVSNAKHTAVAEALSDPDAAVRAAAAAAAGKLRLTQLTDQLIAALSDPALQVGSAAAFAVAALPDGVSRLRQVVSAGPRRAAGVAFEALEKATLGRMELV